MGYTVLEYDIAWACRHARVASSTKHTENALTLDMPPEKEVQYYVYVLEQLVRGHTLLRNVFIADKLPSSTSYLVNCIGEWLVSLEHALPREVHHNLIQRTQTLLDTGYGTLVSPDYISCGARLNTVQEQSVYTSNVVYTGEATDSDGFTPPSEDNIVLFPSVARHYCKLMQRNSILSSEEPQEMSDTAVCDERAEVHGPLCQEASSVRQQHMKATCQIDTESGEMQPLQHSSIGDLARETAGEVSALDGGTGLFTASSDSVRDPLTPSVTDDGSHCRLESGLECATDS